MQTLRKNSCKIKQQNKTKIKKPKTAVIQSEYRKCNLKKHGLWNQKTK